MFILRQWRAGQLVSASLAGRADRALQALPQEPPHPAASRCQAFPLQAVWRGRTQDTAYPERDALRQGSSEGFTNGSHACILPASTVPGTPHKTASVARVQAALTFRSSSCRHDGVCAPFQSKPAHRTARAFSHFCRRRVVACERELRRAGRQGEGALLAVSGPPLNMQDSGYYR